MKKILGLDLGTSSIGWALVNEKETNDEQSSIIKLGVRIVPVEQEEKTKFEEGKPITTNANRTLNRGMRRNLQRYKLRRSNLKDILKKEGWINDKTILCESGNDTTYQTYRLRAKAATEEISLEEFAKVLLMINKKRGYKSNRKTKAEDEGTAIDSIEITQQMYDNNLTVGEYVNNLLQKGEKNIPTFYRSDLVAEFEKIWNKQKEFYPAVLTDDTKKKLNETAKFGAYQEVFGIEGNVKEKGWELKEKTYQWRSLAVKEQIGLEQLAVVLQAINGDIRKSSGLLAQISDRSKELHIENITIGQYKLRELENNPNCSLRNRTFYRQDYLDEFEKIWTKQAQYHKELTDELKKKIRDEVIFYQRPLKSQKGLISICEFENRKIEVNGKDKIVGLRGCPKSSPLFQEFKIWQKINDLEVTRKLQVTDKQDESQLSLFEDNDSKSKTKERTVYEHPILSMEEKNKLFNELQYKEKLTKTQILKLLYETDKGYDLNFKEIQGNTTFAALFKVYKSIVVASGYDEKQFDKQDIEMNLNTIKTVFNTNKIVSDIIFFDTDKQGKDFYEQPAYRLWHLLYSYAGDNSVSGDDSLIEKLKETFGFDDAAARALSNISFKSDYSSLSAKAVRNILYSMKKDGLQYNEACEMAGYRHSKNSLTKEEIENKVLVDKLELLPKNSLRNPVVEKILNQMINVVNNVSDTYGKPDEIRIELARELKANAEERDRMTKNITTATKAREEYKEILKQPPFNIANPSRNDILRYRLYEELVENGYKTLYSNTCIRREKLFGKEFDIEHIIPQALLYDDSFANKTLELRNINIEKGKKTAYDFVAEKYGEDGITQYENKINSLVEKGAISKIKGKNLLMKVSEIEGGFIERDLRETQYISKKAKNILEDFVKTVVATGGQITDKLRSDWGLAGIMKELNVPKYKKADENKVHYEIRSDGHSELVIDGWTKRNDHRHHAMDALTVAFTTRSHIQYLNTLHSQNSYKEFEDIIDNNNHKKLLPSIPIDVLRSEAKHHLENILVSYPSKGKVVSKHINKTKNKNAKPQITLTPRGQLHNETVYGTAKRYKTCEEKVNAAFDENKISTVAKKEYREALLKRLHKYGNDSKKAFTGKNALSKNPIYLDELQNKCIPEKVKTVVLEKVYTQRRDINKDLTQKHIDKVLDTKVREILNTRLKEYDGDAKQAFANLDENPIWFNKEKGVAIKSVVIEVNLNPIALHDKRDNFGNLILDKDGNKQPSDYVQPYNVHHVEIFEDEESNYQVRPVYFIDAVMAAKNGDPIVNTHHEKGWKFVFSMKRNDYFVFPNAETGFNPNEIDLTDPANYDKISPNLYRVQKLAATSKDYWFRNHLETTVTNDVKDVTYKNIKSLNNLKGIVKVRINNIGQLEIPTNK